MREPVRLLYLTGTALERVVRQTMAALGATVREPTEGGVEDGWGPRRAGSPRDRPTRALGLE